MTRHFRRPLLIFSLLASGAVAEPSVETRLFWGDTHLHTAVSTDAAARGNRLGLDEAAQLAALVTAHARVIDQLLIEPDIRARAAKTGQLAVLDPQRGYINRPVKDEEAA